MPAEQVPPTTEWVVSFLVRGDEHRVQAVSAEDLIRTALWDIPEGAQPIASTIARLRDLPPSQHEEWGRTVQRQAEA
jgi:hypothetical protein